MARQLQNGASTSQVSKNMRWEGQLYELKQILVGHSSILFSHVRRFSNKVENALAEEGVESLSSFHVEELEDNGNRPVIWEHCRNLEKEDLKGMTETNNCQTHPNPQQLEDSCRFNSTRIRPSVKSISSSGPFRIVVACMESCELSQSLGGADEPCT